MKDILKKILKRFRFELIRARPAVVNLLLLYQFSVVLDVGANDGQYGEYLRSKGYKGRIVSFEPLAKPFEKLIARALHDSAWEALQVGLGSTEGTGTINIARRSVFSSLLQPLPALKKFASEAAETIGLTEIALRTLDSQLPLVLREGEKAFLKIDTQGYEKEIILGAKKSLRRIAGIQLKLSLTPLHDGEATLAEMVEQLDLEGFALVLIDPVSYDLRKQTLLQIDCVFLRRDTAA